MARNEVAVWAAGVGWLALVASGFWAWERADHTPGSVGRAETTEASVTGRWTLTVFAHPRCPCSRATLDELNLIADAAPDVSIRVRFVRPAGTADGWEHGDAWVLAARVPGADVAADAAGTEARRLGAETSGHAVLADPSGRVVFRGGLTPARGRTGPSAGRSAVLAWVRGGPGAASAPVFGCRLFADGE